jgi:hypothetical protein
MSGENSYKGIGIGTILFLIFMVLKLTNHIDWSWWWITSPLWIPVSLLILFLVIGYIVLKR